MFKSKKMLAALLLLLISLSVFAVSAYKVVSIRIQQGREQDAFNQAAELVRKERNEVASDDEEPPGFPVVLPEYEELYAQNPELLAWITVDGTNVDYPVMHTPNEPMRYLRRAFDGSYSLSGTPFIDAACDPNGSYYLVYGHHMENKTMFAALVKYANIDWYREHPTFRFDTIYERRTYAVMAVFYTDVTQTEGEKFRYYTYTDLSDPEVFDHYLAEVEKAALYDTGITAVYGDELITLSTCSYHAKNGRFVVVAKRIPKNQNPTTVNELSQTDSRLMPV